MRNNKAMLDEAARSVRRTFIGSVAGSVAMLAVVGAAGAYGMPERLTAHAFSVAMTKFNMKLPKTEQTASVLVPVPVVESKPVKLASNAKTPSPVSDVIDEPTTALAPQVVTEFVTEVPAPVAAAPAAPSVMREIPAIAPPVVAPPVAAQPVAAPIVEAVPVVRRTPVVETMPASNPFVPAALPERQPAPAPAPVVTASVAPVAPPVVEERPLLSAPMMFEIPKAADAQVLTALPKTEVIVPPQAAAPAETAKPATKSVLAVDPAMQANAMAVVPAADEFPKSVLIHLPMPKPPLSPAQRLDLLGKDYDKAERCLAQAIYFEARNEPARGQQAVAQVVLNRVFSPYYPKDVCSVVYQNAHRHLSCQFTFACDGKPESVSEQGAWSRANRIAKQTLNAQIWLPEVNKATHYHAAYVRPNWIREMNVMVRYGLHTFYRPRNWGDGSDEAHWGTPANSVKAAPTAAKPLTPAQKRFSYRKA